MRLFSEPGWKKRLNHELLNLSRSNNYRELTWRRLFDKVSPPNKESLLREVAKMIAHGDVSVVYKVTSPISKSVIKEFDSLSDIPDEIFDDTTGHLIEVNPLLDVEMVYVSEARSE